MDSSVFLCGFGEYLCKITVKIPPSNPPWNDVDFKATLIIVLQCKIHVYKQLLKSQQTVPQSSILSASQFCLHYGDDVIPWTT